MSHSQSLCMGTLEMFYIVFSFLFTDGNLYPIVRNNIIKKCSVKRVGKEEQGTSNVKADNLENSVY